MTPARFRWGLILILFGLLLLLQNLDLINSNYWIDLLMLFPIFLIAVGLEKIFSHTKLSFISYVTSIFLFIGGLIIAYQGSTNGSTGYFSKWSYTIDYDAAAQAIDATLDLGESDLTIRDASEKDLLDGDFREFSNKPDIEHHVENGIAYINLKDRTDRIFDHIIEIDTEDRADWYLSFSEKIPLNLNLSGEKGNIHLNLSTTPLKDLKLTVPRTQVYLKLANLEPLVKVNLQGYDANLRLRVPSTSGLKIKGINDAEYMERVGLKPAQDAFINALYDSTNEKIEVDLDENLSSVSIDFY
jgi:hypothetical protein